MGCALALAVALRNRMVLTPGERREETGGTGIEMDAEQGGGASRERLRETETTGADR